MALASEWLRFMFDFSILSDMIISFNEVIMKMCSRCKCEVEDFGANTHICKFCLQKAYFEKNHRTCHICEEKYIGKIKGFCSVKCLILGKTINTETDCWEWQGKLHKGYGRLKADTKQKHAHRLSYEIFKGEIPEGKFICHHCDNPKCCNPEHLFIGTVLENKHDSIKKDRHMKFDQNGSKNRQSKLTEELVLQIKMLFQKGFQVAFVSDLLGIHPKTLQNIKYNKNWLHVEIPN